MSEPGIVVTASPSGVPKARFLAIDGSGSPDRHDFHDAVQALYAIAYATKFALKKAEGTNDPAARERPSWTLMLRLPEPIEERLVEQARAEVKSKRELAALDRVRLERFAEGACAQVLHVGPYSSEGETIELLHSFIRAEGLEPRGRHHEIYLGDPRRVKPERLRTILRQPVA